MKAGLVLFVWGGATALGSFAWCAFAADKPKTTEPASDEPAKAKVAKTNYDAPTFVYLGESRPVLVRLHVEVGGKSIDAAWNQFMESLFKYLDVNGDGVLTKDEVERIPTPEMLMNGGLLAVGRGGFGGRVVAPSLEVLDTNKDGKVSLEELKHYYRQNGGGPFHIQLGQAPASQY